MNYLSHNVVHDQLSVRKKSRDELKVIKPQHVHKVDLNVIVYYRMRITNSLKREIYKIIGGDEGDGDAFYQAGASKYYGECSSYLAYLSEES